LATLSADWLSSNGAIADTHGMDGRYIEPRQVMWAVTEILQEDDRGPSFRVPAILEDTSKSGACLRVKRPLAIGSRLIIKWQREQWSAVARNCRQEGGDFLPGVRRAPEVRPAGKAEPAPVPIEAKLHTEDCKTPGNNAAARPEASLPSIRVSARPMQYRHDQ